MNNSNVQVFTLMRVIILSFEGKIPDLQLSACDIVCTFLAQHTNIDHRLVYAYFLDEFINLSPNSGIEITFLGKPKAYRVPVHLIKEKDIVQGKVIFEVDVQLVQRDICEGQYYPVLDIARFDCLPTYAGQTSLLPTISTQGRTSVLRAEPLYVNNTEQAEDPDYIIPICEEPHALTLENTGVVANLPGLWILKQKPKSAFSKFKNSCKKLFSKQK